MLGNHLFGIYEKALNPADDWDTRFRKIRTLGFDFMEMSVDVTDERLARLDYSDAQLLSIAESARAEGVGIRSMCLSANRRYPIGSADVQTRRKGREIIEKAIHAASVMGIRVILISAYDVYGEPSTPESRQRFRDGLKWASSLAANYQVMLAMENMNIPMTNCMARNLVFEKEVNSPWLKEYLDFGNLYAWGVDPLKDMEAGIGSIVACHVKDTLAGTAQQKGTFEGVPFGTGAVDFPKCFRRLEELHYSGPFVIETWYRAPEDDVENLGTVKKFIEEKWRQNGILSGN